MAKKPSFFERLTGANTVDEFDSFEEEASVKRAQTPGVHAPLQDAAAQLTVDVYQTDADILIRALVAGVRPEDLDVAITRDMVTIQGKRVEQKEVEEDGYVYRELYWGSFARTIVRSEERRV